MFVHLCLSQIISCCILRSEDDPVSLTERQYSPALHALPTESASFFHLLLFLRQPGSISRGNRLGIWGLWVSTHSACFLPSAPKLWVLPSWPLSECHSSFRRLNHYLGVIGWGEGLRAKTPRALSPLAVVLLIHWSWWEETVHGAPGQTERRWLLLFRQHFNFPLPEQWLKCISWTVFIARRQEAQCFFS